IPSSYNWRAWDGLLDGVRTGELPFDKIHGRPLFDWLQAHPEDEAVFAGAMASISRTENAAVARAYDFGRVHELVDVGGSQGHLLAAILQRHRRLRGVLFDQPQVVAGAAAAGFVGAKAVADRIRIASGSFFDGVPAGADGYLMKYIIHDWDDE